MDHPITESAAKTKNYIANTKTSKQAEDTLCPNQVFSSCVYGYCNEKYKTAHNPKSKCREKTMNYHKNTNTFKVISLKHHSTPKTRKIEITQTNH